MPSIDEFIEKLLAQKSSDTINNFYHDKVKQDNLRLYLNYMVKIKGRRVLLVGEAPGYLGCKETGIPFSSGDIFTRFKHPLLNYLAPKITLNTIEKENTATMVWEYLSRKRTTPLFWNSFPFHPHLANQPNTNRRPNNHEIALGVEYLQILAEIFEPEFIAGIGERGKVCAQKAFKDRKVYALRHPSFGGKGEFVKGMDRLLRLRRGRR